MKAWPPLARRSCCSGWRAARWPGSRAPHTTSKGRDMRRANRWTGTMICLAGLGLLSACSSAKREAISVEPAKVQVSATGVKQVVLTAQAAGRIGVTTAPVGAAEPSPSGPVRIVPYAAVLYDADGTTFVYTATGPLVFVRRNVTVESIAGDNA